jgi:alkylation response protein AidB-like acyl-CoA dehydrogenase
VPGLSALGVMGMNLPERFGGPGVTPTAMLMSLVAISRACAATSSMIGAHYLGTDAVLIGGDEAQREQWLPRCASGEWLAAFALTEPRGGSTLQTCAPGRARRRRLSDHGRQALHLECGRGPLHGGLRQDRCGGCGTRVSAFIVPRDLPGIQISSPEKLMGIRGGHALKFRWTAYASRRPIASAPRAPASRPP